MFIIVLELFFSRHVARRSINYVCLPQTGITKLAALASLRLRGEAY
jgi:hypothetical protein